jgi:hypothetical protein
MTQRRLTCLAALLLLAACEGGSVYASGPDLVGALPQLPATGAGNGTASGTEGTFDHPAALGDVTTDVREALARIEEEGPPGYTARVHACRKLPYATLGRVLASRGVNLDGEGAGALYRESDQALGAPNYGARVAESTEVTVATASRMFDLFVQAAPEIIAAMPTLDACRIGDRGAVMFDAEGHCTADGISCLLGIPATETHVALCDTFVARASTPERGRQIAVASMLAANFTCE